MREPPLKIRVSIKIRKSGQDIEGWAEVNGYTPDELNENLTKLLDDLERRYREELQGEKPG